MSAGRIWLFYWEVCGSHLTLLGSKINYEKGDTKKRDDNYDHTYVWVLSKHHQILEVARAEYLTFRGFPHTIEYLHVQPVWVVARVCLYISKVPKYAVLADIQRLPSSCTRAVSFAQKNSDALHNFFFLSSSFYQLTFLCAFFNWGRQTSKLFFHLFHINLSPVSCVSEVSLHNASHVFQQIWKFQKVCAFS